MAKLTPEEEKFFRVVKRPNPTEFAILLKWRDFYLSFDRSTMIRPGSFYQYWYRGLQDRIDVPLEDKTPLVFIYEVDYQKRIAKGLNFHHIPVNIRTEWLLIMRQRFPKQFESDERFNAFIGEERYKSLWRAFKWAANASVRQYRMENIKFLRKIPNNRIAEAFKFYARTYNNASISQIEQRFLKIPKF